MRIAIVGDLHGYVDKLSQIPGDIDYQIQVGDLGVFPDPQLADDKSKEKGSAYGFLPYYNREKYIKIPTYFIRGNHDDQKYLLSLNEVKQIIPNLYYIPDGHCAETDNFVIIGFGGVYSPRTWGMQPNQRSGHRLNHFTRVDHRRAMNTIARYKYTSKVKIFIAHEAPPHGTRGWGCSEIQQLVDEFDPDIARFGHYHYAYTFPDKNYKIVQKYGFEIIDI